MSRYNLRLIKLAYFSLILLLIALVFALCLFFKNIFVVFIFALCINYLLAKPVDFFNRYIHSRALAIFLVFILITAVVILIINNIYPIIEWQIVSFEHTIPLIQSKLESLSYSIGNWLDFEINLNTESQKFLNIENKKNILIGSFKYSIYFLTMCIMTVITSFYLLLDGNRIWQLFTTIFPKTYSKHFTQIKKRIDSNLSALVIGQFKIASIASLVMLSTYLIIGNKFAILLGLLQMLEFIPLFGTWLAFIPAIFIISATSSATKTIIAAAVYLIYSQIIRDYFIVPRIMGSAFGIHPLAVMFGLALGLQLFGTLGILLALPVIGIVSAILDYFINSRSEN